jgi:lysine-N-methylase
MPRTISLPTIQNWSCHSCGDCCRQHEIVVTDAEMRCILDQNWTEADGVPAGMHAFELASHGAPSKYRLAHREDGACVFLDQENHCRIHARFGEPAKPLGCRAFPYTFQPGGDHTVAVGVRFSCPSVAANHGRFVSEQRADLQVLADLAVAPGDWPAPPVSPAQQLDWPDTLRIIARLRDLLSGPEPAALPMRLLHALFVADMLGRASFQKVRGARLDELLDTLIQAAPQETPSTLEDVSAPTTLGKTQFRLVVAQYASRDTLAAAGWAYRLRKMLAGLRLTRGRGQTPALQPSLPAVPFMDLEGPFAAHGGEIDELFARYFQVKLRGLDFCGPACHGLSVVEGFQNLALMYPVSLYVARWVARGQDRTALRLEDGQAALAIVDHNYGRSAMMGRSNFRQRVRWLAGHNEIIKLAAWYSR